MRMFDKKKNKDLQSGRETVFYARIKRLLIYNHNNTALIGAFRPKNLFTKYSR